MPGAFSPVGLWRFPMVMSGFNVFAVHQIKSPFRPTSYGELLAILAGCIVMNWVQGNERFLSVLDQPRAVNRGQLLLLESQYINFTGNARVHSTGRIFCDISQSFRLLQHIFPAFQIFQCFFSSISIALFDNLHWKRSSSTVDRILNPTDLYST